MNWLKEEGFGGIMIWSVDMDDFKGACGNSKFPLIKAMKKELQDYSVKLEYDGPYESNVRGGKYTTKDRKFSILLNLIFNPIQFFFFFCEIIIFF